MGCDNHCTQNERGNSAAITKAEERDHAVMNAASVPWNLTMSDEKSAGENWTYNYNVSVTELVECRLFLIVTSADVWIKSKVIGRSTVACWMIVTGSLSDSPTCSAWLTVSLVPFTWKTSVSYPTFRRVLNASRMYSRPVSRPFVTFDRIGRTNSDNVLLLSC